MKRLLALISCGLLSATICAAQKDPQKTDKTAPAAPVPAATPTVPPPAPSLPPLTVQQIMKKNRAAVGSTFTKEKITSTVATGTFGIPVMGMTGTVEVYSKAPDKQFTISTLNGFGTINSGFDGVAGWAQDPSTGMRDITGPELARLKIASIFDRDAAIDTIYPKMELKGTDVVDGHNAYVIIATTADAGSETWYFDAQTFLLIRQDAVEDSPQGKIPTQTFFEDFRPVGKVMTPYVIRTIYPTFTAVITLTDVKTNVAIDDAKFKKPTAP